MQCYGPSMVPYVNPNYTTILIPSTPKAKGGPDDDTWFSKQRFKSFVSRDAMLRPEVVEEVGLQEAEEPASVANHRDWSPWSLGRRKIELTGPTREPHN